MNNRHLIAAGLAGVAAFLFGAYAVMSQLSDPAPSTPDTVEVPAAPTLFDAGSAAPARIVVSPAYNDAGTKAADVESPPEVIAVAGEGVLTEAQLRPFVAKVRSIVARCSSDLASRHKPPHVVSLSFEVRADGENGHAVEPVLEKTSIQDPYFEACVTDAPLDVQVELRAVGAAKVRVRYP